jgi:DNA processing protein
MSKEGSPPGSPPSAPSAPSADELRAWLRLNHTDGIGAVRGKALLQRFGPPEAVLQAGPAAVAQTLQSVALAQALFRRHPVRDAAVANALAWLLGGAATGGQEAPRSILVLGGAGYPPRLLDLADPPLLLYCVGNPLWLSRPQIGIVGSRNATAIGAATARALAGAVSAAGWTVTSGLAEGIDQAAHQGALGGPGSTVAALGTGIDRIYPSQHHALAQRIAADGALISEQPIGMPPLPANFPRRNRLIAAMASGILVVEATLRSGSLITARLAADLGREVLAVPGSIHSPLARGSNSLIRQGAKLVESADDILSEVPAISRLGLRSAFRTDSMSPSFPAETTSPAPRRPAGQVREDGSQAPADGLPEEQARMLAVMSADPVMLETLAARQCLPIAKALAALQTLELIGLVQRQLDGSYIRCP